MELHDPTQTIRPHWLDEPTGSGPIPAVHLGSTDAPDFIVDQEIGRGGTGVVELAHQTVLKRTVALKRLSMPHDEQGFRALVREAQITSRLQHPGIVPIHAIVEDQDLGPIVVMKRLDGITWTEKLRASASSTDLREHIRIAIGVCFALEYAHSKGVLHLDVKPDNIVVGKFGEVWLVDWGIAFDQNLDAPRTHALGTPAYMAPEMVDPTQFPITERSDVYLVAACLFEALFEEPPHQGPDTESSMIAAFESVDFPEDSVGPQTEIINLVRAALAPDPSDRPPNIASLRNRLESVLEHEDSERLVTEILRALHGSTSSPDLRTLETQLGAALSLWPQSPRGLAALSTLKCRQLVECLDAGDLHTAERVAFTLPNVPADLEARLATLRRVREAEVAALALARQNAEQSSMNRHLRMRRQATGLAVALYVFLPPFSYWLNPGATPAPPPTLLVYAILPTLVWVTLITVKRHQFFANFANRAATLSVTGALFAGLVNRSVSLYLDADPVEILQREMLLIIGIFAAQISLHRGFALIAAGYALEWVICLYFPDLTRHAYNAGGLAGGLAAMVLWSDLSDAEPAT